MHVARYMYLTSVIVPFFLITATGVNSDVFAVESVDLESAKSGMQTIFPHVINFHS